MRRIRVCYTGTAAGDYGGASRVLFTHLAQLNRDLIEPLVLLPSQGPIQQWLDEQGIAHEIWGADVHEPNGWMRYGAQVLRSLRLFRRHRIDILHLHTSSYWRPAEILAARLAGVPVVTHLHVVRRRAAPFQHLSSLLVANSRFTANASDAAGVPVEVIHNSVDPDRFRRGRDIRDELGVKRRYVVTFLGQIKEIKGIGTFIEVARSLRDEDVEFWIFGECRPPGTGGGTYSEERLAAEIGDAANVCYGGYRSDVENLYHVSDVIVVPSAWEEPFGLINIEAGICARPVVSSRVGGIPEIVEDGLNGFLVERADVAGYASRVRQLLSDERLRRRMGEAARSVVLERFCDAPVRRLEEVYSALIAKRRRGGASTARA